MHTCLRNGIESASRTERRRPGGRKRQHRRWTADGWRDGRLGNHRAWHQGHGGGWDQSNVAAGSVANAAPVTVGDGNKAAAYQTTGALRHQKTLNKQNAAGAAWRRRRFQNIARQAGAGGAATRSCCLARIVCSNRGHAAKRRGRRIACLHTRRRQATTSRCHHQRAAVPRAERC